MGHLQRYSAQNAAVWQHQHAAYLALLQRQTSCLVHSTHSCLCVWMCTLEIFPLGAQAGVPCTSACRCTGCQNHKGEACNGAGTPETGAEVKPQRQGSRASGSDLRPAGSGHSDERTVSEGTRRPVAPKRRPKPSVPDHPPQLPPGWPPAGYHYVMQPVDEPMDEAAQQPVTSRAMPPPQQAPSLGRPDRQDRPHPSRRAHPPLQIGVSPPMRGPPRPPQHASSVPRHELPAKRSLASPNDEPWAQDTPRPGSSKVSPREKAGMLGLHALAGATDPTSPGSPLCSPPISEHHTMDDQDFLCREEAPDEQGSDGSPQGDASHDGSRVCRSQQGQGSRKEPKRDGQLAVRSAGIRLDLGLQMSGSRRAPHPNPSPMLPQGYRPPYNPKMPPGYLSQKPPAHVPAMAPVSPTRPIQEAARPAAYPRARLHPEDRHRVARRIDDHEILATQASQVNRLAGETSQPGGGKPIQPSKKRSQ